MSFIQSVLYQRFHCIYVPAPPDTLLLLKELKESLPFLAATPGGGGGGGGKKDGGNGEKVGEVNQKRALQYYHNYLLRGRWPHF